MRRGIRQDRRQRRPPPPAPSLPPSRLLALAWLQGLGGRPVRCGGPGGAGAARGAAFCCGVMSARPAGRAGGSQGCRSAVPGHQEARPRTRAMASAAAAVAELRAAAVRCGARLSGPAGRREPGGRELGGVAQPPGSSPTLFKRHPPLPRRRAALLYPRRRQPSRGSATTPARPPPPTVWRPGREAALPAASKVSARGLPGQRHPPPRRKRPLERAGGVASHPPQRPLAPGPPPPHQRPVCCICRVKPPALPSQARAGLPQAHGCAARGREAAPSGRPRGLVLRRGAREQGVAKAPQTTPRHAKAFLDSCPSGHISGSGDARLPAARAAVASAGPSTCQGSDSRGEGK